MWDFDNFFCNPDQSTQAEIILVLLTSQNPSHFSRLFLFVFQLSLEPSGTSDYVHRKNVLNYWQEAQRSKMWINESSRHVLPVDHRPHVPHNI